MSINPDCEICSGGGRITLPVRRPAFSSKPELCTDPHISFRVYACPECSEAVPQERVAVVSRLSSFDEQHAGPEFMSRAKTSMVMSLAGLLAQKGLVTFKRSPPPDGPHFEVAASVGVVSPERVASLEERVALHQLKLAREVVAEAAQRIRNWGSFYGHTGITKDCAVRELNEALSVVLARRSAVRSV